MSPAPPGYVRPACWVPSGSRLAGPLARGTPAVCLLTPTRNGPTELDLGPTSARVVVYITYYSVCKLYPFSPPRTGPLTGALSKFAERFHPLLLGYLVRCDSLITYRNVFHSDTSLACCCRSSSSYLGTRTGPLSRFLDSARSPISAVPLLLV